jgi:hypothetical protein
MSPLDPETRRPYPVRMVHPDPPLSTSSPVLIQRLDDVQSLDPAIVHRIPEIVSYSWEGFVFPTWLRDLAVEDADERIATYAKAWTPNYAPANPADYEVTFPTIHDAMP